MSTKLDTQAKVIALYGGTAWTQIGGRFLIGANSTYKVGDTGGSSTHKITESELPSHKHGIPKLTGTARASGVHSHNTNATWPFYWGDSKGGAPWATPWNQTSNINSGNPGTTSNGSHTHTVEIGATNTNNTGSGSAMDILNPYEAVYIWKRTA